MRGEIPRCPIVILPGVGGCRRCEMVGRHGPGWNGPPLSSRRSLSLVPPSAKCEHLHEDFVNDAPDIGCVNTISAVPLSFSSAVTSRGFRSPAPGFGRALRRLVPLSGPGRPRRSNPPPEDRRTGATANPRSEEASICSRRSISEPGRAGFKANRTRNPWRAGQRDRPYLLTSWNQRRNRCKETAATTVPHSPGMRRCGTISIGSWTC